MIDESKFQKLDIEDVRKASGGTGETYDNREMLASLYKCNAYKRSIYAGDGIDCFCCESYREWRANDENGVQHWYWECTKGNTPVPR